MSDHDKRKSNNDDLKDVKSLIGDATGADFDLDDILAEYGSGKSRDRGAVPVVSREKEQGGPQGHQTGLSKRCRSFLRGPDH